MLRRYDDRRVATDKSIHGIDVGHPGAWPMIILHHLEQSRSQRILWLLEELDAPYEVRRYGRDPLTRVAPPELRSVHPLGKSPVIEDGDLVLAESGVIVEYLCSRFPERGLAPEMGAGGPLGRQMLRWKFWVHYAEGSPMAPLLLQLLLQTIDAPEVRALREGFVRRELIAHADFWESELGDGDWFAGDGFSAADVMMTFPMEAAERFGVLAGRPNAAGFLERVRRRAGYISAAEASRAS